MWKVFSHSNEIEIVNNKLGSRYMLIVVKEFLRYRYE